MTVKLSQFKGFEKKRRIPTYYFPDLRSYMEQFQLSFHIKKDFARRTSTSYARIVGFNVAKKELKY